MQLDDLLEKMKNTGCTDADFTEALRLFEEDIETEGKHIDQLYEFYALSVYKYNNSFSYFKSIHNLASKYLSKGFKTDNIHYLYFLETVYFYYADSPSEILKYANKLLMMDERVKKGTMYCYALMVFLRLGMYDEAMSYIDEAEIYISSHPTIPRQKYHIWINELDIYASSKQFNKYLATVEKLDNLLESIHDDPDYSLFDVCYRIHKVYAEVMLQNYIYKDKVLLAMELRTCFAFPNINRQFSENYAVILIPVFRYLKEEFTTPELIHYVKAIMESTMNTNEKVQLLRFLFEECGIEPESYPSLYQKYLSALVEYFDGSQSNKAAEVTTEILNFSMQQKFDIVNAKYQFDALTGCYNRVFLSEIEETIIHPGDYVIYMDLNDFKSVNDSFGHDKGDEQLKWFASVLLRTFENDVVLRLGGDEFVVLTHGVSEDVLAKLDEARQEYLSRNTELRNRYGFSAGVVFGNGIMLHEAITQADNAMYDCKKNNLPCIIREL